MEPETWGEFHVEENWEPGQEESSGEWCKIATGQRLVLKELSKAMQGSWKKSVSALQFFPVPALLNVDGIIIGAQLHSKSQWFMMLYNQHWINLSQ